MADNVGSKSGFKIGDLTRSLSNPFHPVMPISSTSGLPQVVGYDVGLSWEPHRTKALGPFVADAVPAATDRGGEFFSYPQARIYFSTDPTGNGLESLRVQIWYRHRPEDDLSTRGPWIKGPLLTMVAQTEEFITTSFYREVYAQCLTYTANGSAAVDLTVHLAPCAGVDPGFSSEINIEAGNIDVQIEAIPAATEIADSAIMAGTLDGVVPLTPGASTPATTKAIRVSADGDQFDLATLAMLGYRKVLGLGLGAYTKPAGAGATAVSFTGAYLTDRVKWVYNVTDHTRHRVTNVVDPSGATPGTLTVDPALTSATPTLLIPVLSLPAAYDLLADAERTNQLNPPQNHCLFDPGISVTIAAGQPDTVDMTWNVSAHNRVTLKVDWTCGSTATWQIDVLMRATAGGVLRNINSFFRVAGSPLGAAVGGTAGLAATSIEPIKAYELVVRRTGVNGAAPAAHSMTGSVNLHYA